ncbi:MAG: hypothetical protein WCT40_01270 [Candidatus Magasanikbacteria bacterium]
MNLIKKVFTFSVVATTIMWSLGVAALVPAVAQADDVCPSGLVAGDMVKVATSPVIYVLDNQMKVATFINNATSGTGSAKVYYSGYKSWNLDENYSFKAVSFDCLNKLGWSTQSVGPRPGSYVIKHPADGNLYAVGLGRTCYKVTDALAKQLYGTNYKAYPLSTTQEFSGMCANGVGVDWTEAKAHPGMLVSKDGKTYFVNSDKTLTEITAEGMTANRVKSSWVRALDAALLPAVGTAVAVTKYESALGDRSQSGVASAGNDTVATGALTVSLSANTPAATNLPDGTSFNPILKFTLNAGPEAVTVSGVTLKKGGYVLNTNISGIDIVDGSDVRHGNVVSSVNSDNEVLILFGSNPVVVPAGGSVTLTARVNLGASAGGSTVKLGVKSVVSTAATVGGSFPFYGNEFNTVDGANAVATAYFDALSVSGSAGTDLNADADNEQEITKFRLQEYGSKEDLKLYKLVLFNYGNAADADYKDVQLVSADGTVLATAQPASQYVTFDLSASPYLIAKGQYKDLTVRAKIVSGTSKTIQFVAYNDYDVMVKGSDSGSYVLPTVSGGAGYESTFPVGDLGAASVTTFNKVTIAAGTLSFNKDTTSPTSAVAPGASNVVLAKYYVKPTGENMELRKVSFGIIQTDSALTGNVYVKVDGATVWSGAVNTTEFPLAGTVGTKTLNTYPILTAGKNAYITVEGSVPSTATSTVRYTVNDFDITEVKKLTSNTIADPAVNTADGNQISVNAASLSAKTLSTPVAQNIISGATGFTFAQFELSANTSGEDVRISSIVVSNVGTGTTTNILNLALWDGTTQLTTSNNTGTGAASTTFSLTSPLVITKGTTKTLVLKADYIGTTANVTHKFMLHTVTATGKDTGTSVTPSVSGMGQAMTTASGPTVTLSLVSGTGAAPSANQVVQVATNDGTYFAFKITPSNEAIKLTTLKLTATGTGLNTNDVTNLRLYRNSETTPFQSLGEMTCSSNSCTATWGGSTTDNLLPEAVQPGSPVTVYLKADVGAAGVAKLGDDFTFKINATTTDFVAKGATTNGSAHITGTPTASGATHIVPFTVKVESVSPTTPATIGLSTGATVGVFKVTNLGNAQVALTKLSFANGGASTSSLNFALKYSTDGGAQTDTTGGTASTTATNRVDFGTLDTAVTINGGSWRYFTVKTSGTAVNYDTFQLSVSLLGDIVYKVKDIDLGYDGDTAGGITDTYANTGLYTSGLPALESVTARS